MIHSSRILIKIVFFFLFRRNKQEQTSVMKGNHNYWAYLMWVRGGLFFGYSALMCHSFELHDVNVNGGGNFIESFFSLKKNHFLIYFHFSHDFVRCVDLKLNIVVSMLLLVGWLASTKRITNSDNNRWLNYIRTGFPSKWSHVDGVHCSAVRNKPLNWRKAKIEWRRNKPFVRRW